MVEMWDLMSSKSLNILARLSSPKVLYPCSCVDGVGDSSGIKIILKESKTHTILCDLPLDVSLFNFLLTDLKN